MNAQPSPIRHISDTARWVAVYRARESERPDAVFRDPFARRLAGERGEQIAASMPFAEKNSWSFVARTWLIDKIIGEQVRAGADMVINLAAGLDARPYRMEPPTSLQWIEVDMPEILAEKEAALRNEKPACSLERIPLNLSDVQARRDLFAMLARRAQRALVVSEGLLTYLTEDEVASLGSDLAAVGADSKTMPRHAERSEASLPSVHPFRHWIVDVGSPALMRMLKKQMSAPLDQAGLPLKFAPQDGPEFFTRCGWKLEQTHSIVHAASKLKRAPFFLRLLAKISSGQFTPNRPWSAVCLLARQ